MLSRHHIRLFESGSRSLVNRRIREATPVKFGVEIRRRRSRCVAPSIFSSRALCAILAAAGSRRAFRPRVIIDVRSGRDTVTHGCRT